MRPEFFPANKPKALPPLGKSPSSRPISNDIKGSQIDMKGSQMGQEVPVNKVKINMHIEKTFILFRLNHHQK